MKRYSRQEVTSKNGSGAEGDRTLNLSIANATIFGGFRKKRSITHAVLFALSRYKRGIVSRLGSPIYTLESAQNPSRKTVSTRNRGWMVPRISMQRFRDEVLALYEPPLRARHSWFKVRQVLDILRNVGCRSTSDFTPGTVARFVASNPAWKPATVKGLLGYLSPIFSYAKLMGYVRIDPFSIRRDWYRSPELVDDDRAEPDRYLSVDDLSRLLDLLESRKASWTGGRLYALTATFAYTGMRRNEGLTRAVADFDLTRRIVTLKPRKIRLKTVASAQPVGLPNELVPILEEWLPRTGSKWAFPGIRGNSPWTGGSMGKRPLDELQAAAGEIGIHATWQMFRHTWATLAEARGIGELMVQRQLRHTSKRTQLHYRHADAANIANAVGSFSVRLKIHQEIDAIRKAN